MDRFCQCHISSHQYIVKNGQNIGKEIGVCEWVCVYRYQRKCKDMDITKQQHTKQPLHICVGLLSNEYTKSFTFHGLVMKSIFVCLLVVWFVQWPWNAAGVFFLLFIHLSGEVLILIELKNACYQQKLSSG